MTKAKPSSGVIRADEAYSKSELLSRLGVSQKFWDKMIAGGLPVAYVGHARWTTGRSVIEYIERNAEPRRGSAGNAE